MSQYCKRLIEVDLPIKKISEHSRREKSIRHGHISTLHIWWARRPLAACRAVILASLLPDPADTDCPEEFRKKAIEVIKQVRGGNLEDPLVLRKALLDFIADFSAWEMSTNQVYLNIARELVSAAHIALGGEPGTRPLVVDPFAGGGSIPLEALRVGADAFAMDYNPVAVLILKVLLEYIPKYGHKLAEEVKKWGDWIKKEAEKELLEFYPRDPDGSTPIAYIWARTIKCEGPGCGAEVPLMRSLWLAKKGKNSVALKMIPNKKEKRVDFEIIKGDLKDKDVQSGTVKRGSATCPVCGYTTPLVRVREQAKDKGLPVRMIAVVTSKPGQSGKNYRLPTEQDLKAVELAEKELERRKREHKGALSLVPDEKLPPEGTLGFRIQKYGLKNWGDMFTSRQVLALSVFTNEIHRVYEDIFRIRKKEDEAKCIISLLSLGISRLSDRNSAFCRWIPQTSAIGFTFGRQALPMIWDFVEINPYKHDAGWNGVIQSIEETVINCGNSISLKGTVQHGSAVRNPLPNDVGNAIITDPPYYDAVPYADLSNYFYVWLKRAVGLYSTDLFSSTYVLKKEEIIVDPSTNFKDASFFEEKMTQAMRESQRILKRDGVGVVVFAHKSTIGWEAMLSSMLNACWSIRASWPIDTERPGRLRAQESAALASSIHIVCRPRPENAGVGDWRQVLSELQPRIHEWMPRLAKEGIVGADAIFSCLGPALEIFSRYERVETASGKKVELKEYLEHVWAAVAREALNMIFEGADASGFEEDSRLTALWLWTLHSSMNNISAKANNEYLSDEAEEISSKKTLKGFYLEYDAVRKIAQGLGAHLEVLSGPGGIIEIKGDKARLLPVSERRKTLLGKDEKFTPRRKKKSIQTTLFEMPEEVQEEVILPLTGKTVLDRLHQAMLLFADGRSEALRRFIVDEGVGNDDRFWRLAQSLSALYPNDTDEKRWIDGVLARKKSFGF